MQTTTVTGLTKPKKLQSFSLLSAGFCLHQSVSCCLHSSWKTKTILFFSVLRSPRCLLVLVLERWLTASSSPGLYIHSLTCKACLTWHGILFCIKCHFFHGTFIITQLLRFGIRPWIASIYMLKVKMWTSCDRWNKKVDKKYRGWFNTGSDISLYC